MPTAFEMKLYDKLKEVPIGHLTTYKDLANAVNSKAYRAVGNAMNKNPFAPKVPCHRVVNSDGTLGGFAHGSSKKIEILKQEGVEVQNNKVVNFTNKLWKF